MPYLEIDDWMQAGSNMIYSWIFARLFPIASWLLN